MGRRVKGIGGKLADDNDAKWMLVIGEKLGKTLEEVNGMTEIEFSAWIWHFSKGK